MPPPLFIIGTSRSGTSWAFELCAGHPDMSMGYEAKLPVEGAELYRRHASKLSSADGMAAFFNDLAGTIDDPSSVELMGTLGESSVVDRAVEAHRRAPGWASICEAVFCAWEDTTNWGNKLLRIELMPTLTEHWPDARFLVLTRDPRGVMASQSSFFDHSIEYSAMYWNTHAGYLRDVLHLAPGDHDDRVFVTDLVEMATDPRPAMEWAFAEVGLDTAPIEDLVARHPGDPGRLDAWRTTIDQRQQRRIEEYCFDTMSALGYRPELATAHRPISRPRRLIAMAQEHGGELVRDPGAIRRKQVGRRALNALGIRR